MYYLYEIFTKQRINRECHLLPTMMTKISIYYHLSYIQQKYVKIAELKDFTSISLKVFKPWKYQISTSLLNAMTCLPFLLLHQKWQTSWYTRNLLMFFQKNVFWVYVVYQFQTLVFFWEVQEIHLLHWFLLM